MWRKAIGIIYWVKNLITGWNLVVPHVSVIIPCLIWLTSLSLLPWQLSGGCELTVVLQDFAASHSSELSIQVGQTVELLERPSERPGWCLVRTTERTPPQEGLVPSSALCISHSRSSVEMDCFFPSGKGRQKLDRTDFLPHFRHFTIKDGWI